MKKITSMALAAALVTAECAVPFNVKADTQQMDYAVAQSEAEVSMAQSRSIASGAEYLANGASVSGSLGNVEEKYYKIDMPSSGRLQLKLDGECEDYIGLYVYDADAEEILWKGVDANQITGKVTLDMPIDLTKGVYYLKIRSGNSDFQYTMKTAFTPADESFPESGNGTNNTIAEAKKIEYKQQYRGQLAETDVQDMYRFEMASSGVLSFQLNSEMERMDFVIYDGDGKEVWNERYHEWDSTTKKHSMNEKLQLTQGTYYLEIGSHTTMIYHASTGNYTFKLDFTSVGESFPETGFGVNNEIATASRIELGKSYKGQLAENDRNDYYSFVKNASKDFYVNFDSEIETVPLAIYDNNGKQVWNHTVHMDQTTKRTTLKEKVELPAGTYTLQVESIWDQTGTYTFSVGSPAVIGWKQQNGKWYYYNSDGSVSVGWHSISGKWYYFDGKGVMQTGWQRIGGKWYYLNGSGAGAMAKGWKKVGNIWYYFNGSGVMQTGWQKINNIWYYFNGSGYMKTGWQRISGKWYYFNGSGYMKTGWQKISGKWYYLNSSGAMVTGTLKINGKIYKFSGTGICLNP